MPGWSCWGPLLALAVATAALRLGRRAPLGRGDLLRLGRVDLLVAAAALAALGFHCAAMFFPSAVAAVPGADGLAERVRDFGAASQVEYWLPAGLLVLALRHAWRPLLVVEAAVLAAVGVTMFWSFGLEAHLTAIAAAFVVTAILALAAGSFVFVRQPGDRQLNLRWVASSPSVSRVSTASAARSISPSASSAGSKFAST